MVEDATYLRRGVGNDVFVLYAQHLPGQHGVPVIHHLDVVAVVKPCIREVVGELLALGKQLFETAEAAGHGVTARVDDRCIGQDEMDQPDVPEIVRHLVDEERRSLAMDAGIVDVFLAERFEFFIGQFGKYAGVFRCTVLPRPAPQPLRQRQDVGQLQRPIDLRMRRQDLLEQRRSGARQSDDEDRVRRRMTAVRASLEQFPGADLPLGLEIPGHLLRFVGRL